MTETIPFGDCDAALAAVSDDVLARLDGPTDKVRGLPNEAFTSDAFFELERKCLFPRSWMFAGRANEIPEPGDARPVEVAGPSAGSGARQGQANPGVSECLSAPRRATGHASLASDGGADLPVPRLVLQTGWNP